VSKVPIANVIPANNDEAAIRALLARMYDAWTRGDGKAYAACFTENSDYITFNGLHLRGRTENAALHGALFRGPLKGSKLSAEIVGLEFLAPGVVLLHTASKGRKPSYQTIVLIKQDGDWFIRSFQNSRVQTFSVWITRWLQRRYSH
jgi:uncharacterized protein (TIGR02246 family)